MAMSCNVPEPSLVPCERQASGFTLGYELHAYLGKLAEAWLCNFEISEIKDSRHRRALKAERSSSLAEKHYSAALASKERAKRLRILWGKQFGFWKRGR